MNKLKGKQRKYLRSLAHSYKPHIMVGKNSLFKGALYSIKLSLEANELIKIKFLTKTEMFNSKDHLKKELDCHIVGDIGKTLIVYKKNKKRIKNHIIVPD